MSFIREFDRENSDEVRLAQTSNHLSNSRVAGDSDLFPGSGAAQRRRRWQLDQPGFSGSDFWTYVTLLAIHIIVSCVALLLFPKAGALRIELGSLVIAVVLLITGVAAYGKLRRVTMSNEYRKMMIDRRPLMNVIELKEWWYVPDESHPTEIRVDVVTHQPGRFAGNVTGEQTDSSGALTTIFESTNGPDSQRQVRTGEDFTYAFPLKFLSAGQADDVRITLYLFKAPDGPAAGDITKVFVKSPQRDDDGEYFYGVLPPPSQPEK